MVSGREKCVENISRTRGGGLVWRGNGRVHLGAGAEQILDRAGREFGRLRGELEDQPQSNSTQTHTHAHKTPVPT